jgi:hypothetical protein
MKKPCINSYLVVVWCVFYAALGLRGVSGRDEVGLGYSAGLAILSHWLADLLHIFSDACGGFVRAVYFVDDFGHWWGTLRGRCMMSVAFSHTEASSVVVSCVSRMGRGNGPGASVKAQFF